MSRVEFRRSAVEVGEGEEERTERRRSVLLRRQASRMSSRGVAPWEVSVMCGGWRGGEVVKGEAQRGTYLVSHYEKNTR